MANNFIFLTMRTIIIALFFLLITACTENKCQNNNDFIVADGQMPAIAKDNNNVLHLVFGNGDSIMYTYSNDKGHTFSPAELITKLPGAFSYAMRGPQIAAAANGIIVTVCTKDGNIYSFHKEVNSSWKRSGKVNDEDTVCKEGLMALSADGNNAFAAWLDLRGNKRNKIYGARSADGGITWSRNILIYASPDSTVCECCKPSVVVSKNKVAVMFRNWLNGNRDLYLAQSDNGDNTFDTTVKLGMGSWQLDGCPMDGGNLTVNDNGAIQTVWRRQSGIYFAEPGTSEKQIGEGRNCTIEIMNKENVYAWTENGQIIFIEPGGKKKTLGEGSEPVLKSLDDKHIICLWQNNKQIHASVLQL